MFAKDTMPVTYLQFRVRVSGGGACISWPYTPPPPKHTDTHSHTPVSIAWGGRALLVGDSLIDRGFHRSDSPLEELPLD